MKKTFLILITSALLMGSCKKAAETIDEIQKDRIMAEDNHSAEDDADDISIMSDEAYNYNKLSSRGGSGASGIMGDTVKIIRNNTDSTITIDFGNGVIGKNGKTRKGKIIIKYTGGYWKSGAVITQTFDNYFVNGRKIEGNRSITNNGINNGIPSWSIQSSLTITKVNGKTITWNSNRTRTMTKGYGSQSWTDDEYTVSGSANGTTSNGDNYTLTIGKSLLIVLSYDGVNLCKYIQDGTLTYTRNSRSVSLDYGYRNPASSNACDNQAELNYNGSKTIITL